MPDHEIFETANGFPSPSELHRADANARHRETDRAAPSQDDRELLAKVTERLSRLTSNELQELSSQATAEACKRQQQENLQTFIAAFPAAVDSRFQTSHGSLFQSFLNMVSGMEVQISEQAIESTSSTEGTITIGLPGLPDGVNVTRSRDTFFVNDGRTMLERNEVRIKMGGLDVYSGYWLAADAPACNIEDPLQEEGIDTLRRIMEAAGLDLFGDIYEDALEYPFLSAMLAPFGPEAARPFEAHLRRLHKECTQRHGGCWYKMSSTAKTAAVGEVLETGTSHGTADGEVDVRTLPRSQLTAAEEAELELSKLDL